MHIISPPHWTMADKWFMMEKDTVLFLAPSLTKNDGHMSPADAWLSDLDLLPCWLVVWWWISLQDFWTRARSTGAARCLRELFRRLINLDSGGWQDLCSDKTAPSVTQQHLPDMFSRSDSGRSLPFDIRQVVKGRAWICAERHEKVNQPPVPQIKPQNSSWVFL